MRALLYADWCTIRSMLHRYLGICILMNAIMCATALPDASNAFEAAESIQQSLVMVTLIMMTFMCFFGLFTIDERVGWEAMRLSLPISRGEVVRSRYVFLLGLVFILALTSSVLGLVASGIATELAFGMPVAVLNADTLISGCLGILVTVLYASIEMPIFFWKGATKARYTFSLPLLLMPLLTIPGVGESLAGLTVTPQLALVVGVPITIAAFTASLAISKRLYAAKDF